MLLTGQPAGGAVPGMHWLMSRLLALGTALVVTVILLFAADLASRYVGKRTRLAAPQPTHEYTIDLHPVPTAP